MTSRPRKRRYIDLAGLARNTALLSEFAYKYDLEFILLESGLKIRLTSAKIVMDVYPDSGQYLTTFDAPGRPSQRGTIPPNKKCALDILKQQFNL